MLYKSATNCKNKGVIVVTKDLERLLTVSEVAEVCQCGQETVRRWLRTGKLVGITLPGGSYRIRREDLEGMLKGVG
jgi:excisionase family DNA binding protein